MSKKYVLRLLSFDSDQPLRGETGIIELGFDVDRPLVEGLENLAGLLRMLKTPEAVAEFINQNKTIALKLRGV